MERPASLRGPSVLVAGLLAVVAVAALWSGALPKHEVAFTGPYPGGCPDGWIATHTLGSLEATGCTGSTPWTEWPSSAK